MGLLVGGCFVENGVAVMQVRTRLLYSKLPPGYFTHVSITTPVVPALNCFSTQSFLEAQRVFKSLLDPGGRFGIEAAITYPINE